MFSLLERQRSSTGVFIVLLRCHATRPKFFRFPPIRVDDYEPRRTQDKPLLFGTAQKPVLCYILPPFVVKILKCNFR